MKKHLFFTAMILPLVVSCSSPNPTSNSSSVPTSTSQYTPAVVRTINKKVLNEQSDKFKAVDITFDKTKIWLLIDSLEILIRDKTTLDIDAFESQMDEFFNLFSDLITKLYKSRALYSGIASDENYEAYSTLFDEYGTIYNWYISMFPLIRDSGYRLIFFGDMSDEEINKEIEDNKSDETTKQYESEMMDIQNEFDNLYNRESEMTTKEFSVATLELFKRYYTSGTNLATYLGYNSFQEYSYKKDYDRHYLPSETADLVANAKDTFIKAFNRYVGYSFDTPAQSDKYDLISSTNFMYSQHKCSKSFSAFAEKMGEEYTLTFNNLMNDGVYYFSNNTNYSGTAFVSNFDDEQPMMFMSRDYQTISNFSHEFGHYLKSYLNDENFSFDIEETHSNGNEMLYASFVKDYLKNDSYWQAYDAYSYFEVLDAVYGGIHFASVVDVENYCYTNADKTAEELYDGIVEILKGYPSSIDKKYWSYVLVSSPCYYISYLTSSVAALDLFFKAEDNFDEAKECYLNLVHYEDCNKSEDEIFTECGIASPFDEETYTNLLNSLYYFI